VLDLLILLWAGGVITGEVKVAQDSTHLGYDLLELILLLLLVSEAVLLLLFTLVARVVPVVVILIRGVERVPLGAVGNEVGGVTALKAALGDLLLSFWNLCKAHNFVTSRAISLSGMLSYYSSEVVAKEDKANYKADETMVLVGLASWPPTW
jgi:hypothetical protein